MRYLKAAGFIFGIVFICRGIGRGTDAGTFAHDYHPNLSKGSLAMSNARVIVKKLQLSKISAPWMFCVPIKPARWRKIKSALVKYVDAEGNADENIFTIRLHFQQFFAVVFKNAAGTRAVKDFKKIWHRG